MQRIEWKRYGRAMWPIFALTFFLNACAFFPQSAQPSLPSAGETIVVYGGFGFLDKRAQPKLAQILDRQTGAAATDGPILALVGRDAAVSRLLPGISDHPVIGDDDAFAQAVAEQSGTAVSQVSGLTIKDRMAGRTVLVLSLIAGLEQDYELESVSDAGLVYRRVIITTVSAVLSRPASGEVLLVGDATTILEIKSGQPNAEDIEPALRAYADVLPRAVEALVAN